MKKLVSALITTLLLAACGGSGDGCTVIGGHGKFGGHASFNTSTIGGGSQILVAPYQDAAAWTAYWLVVRKVWIPADVSQVQVHISNRNDANDTAYDTMTTDVGIGTGTLSNPPAWSGSPTIYSGVSLSGSNGYTTPLTSVTRDANGYIMIAYYLPPGVTHGLEGSPYGWEQPNALSSTNLVSTLNSGAINPTAGGAPLHVAVKFASSTTKRLTLIGDSLQRGLAGSGTPAGLANTLAQIAGTYGVNVCSAGIGGQTFTAVVNNATPSFFDDVNIGASTVVMIALGSNDLAGSSAADLETALQTLVTRYQGLGVSKIWAWTITPKNAHYAARDTYNAWLLATPPAGVEYVLDAAGRLQNPSNHDQLDPAYDCGDHLHFSPAAYTVLINKLVADGRIASGGVIN